MFLCTNCKKNLCPECREMESEYEELLNNYKQANARLSQEVAGLRTSLDVTKQRAATFESLAKMGYPELLKQWMDSLADQSSRNRRQ